VIEVNEGAIWPELLVQLLPGDHLALFFKQQSQNLERLVLQA
jgi:hypothetical protein